MGLTDGPSRVEKRSPISNGEDAFGRALFHSPLYRLRRRATTGAQRDEWESLTMLGDDHTISQPVADALISTTNAYPPSDS